MDALGLDARVARAAAKRGYAVPTPVQAAAIPLALAGKVRLPKAAATLAAAGRAARTPRHRSPHAPQRSRCVASCSPPLTRALPLRPPCIAAQDVIAQAVTGSGKTAAYLLPALHRLLTQAAEAAPPPRALVLVPTRELCTQARPPPCVCVSPRLTRSPLHRPGSRRGCRARRCSGRHAARGAAAARGRAGSSARSSRSRPARLAGGHAGARGAGAAGGALPPGRHHERPAASRCAPPAPLQRKKRERPSSGGCACAVPPLTPLSLCTAQCWMRRTCCCRLATRTTLPPSPPSCLEAASACWCPPLPGAPLPLLLRCARARAPPLSGAATRAASV